MPARMTSVEYIRKGGAICPFFHCGSRKTPRIGQTSISKPGRAAREVICVDCGRCWLDIYELVGYAVIEVENEPT
jgi:hypothetical protein